MITIQEEGAALCVGTLCGLFKEHGDLVIGPAFNLNLMAFHAIIANGDLKFFVIRDNGEAVGYSCFAIQREFMVAHKTTAECMAIYVREKYRARQAIRMIRLAEESLKDAGVSSITMHVPATMGQTKLYEKMGYAPAEMVYCKEF